MRIDGIAAIHREGTALDAGRDLLRAKYAQYQSVPLNGPVIAVVVQRWSSWHREPFTSESREHISVWHKTS